MTSWFRLWHDMPTDPKWRVIARKSGQPIPVVMSVYLFVLTSASCNAEKRGVTQGLRADDIAAALDVDEGDVLAVLDAMQGRVLEGDHVTGWEKRQPRREDSSSERVKRWRERNVTQRNAPDADADADSEKESKKKKRASARDVDRPPEVDPKVWDDFKAHRKAMRAPVTDTAIAGICREAAKAQISLSDALRTCCERGWRGFKADWVQQARGSPLPYSQKTARNIERLMEWANGIDGQVQMGGAADGDGRDVRQGNIALIGRDVLPRS